MSQIRGQLQILLDGMLELQFEPYLDEAFQSPIITSFLYPQWPSFDFEGLYTSLASRGFVIYPGKVSSADTFRIGTIGHLWPHDVSSMLSVLREIMMALPRRD